VLVANLLARELVCPVVAAVVGHDAGDYERHVECICGCESSCVFCKSVEKNRVDGQK
jgi:hypothetical protein